MSKYRYQVVVHYPHYPSSVLFEWERKRMGREFREAL